MSVLGGSRSTESSVDTLARKEALQAENCSSPDKLTILNFAAIVNCIAEIDAMHSTTLNLM